MKIIVFYFLAIVSIDFGKFWCLRAKSEVEIRKIFEKIDLVVLNWIFRI